MWLPIDGPGDAEVGQLVAFDSTGPLRLGFGGWRDTLLGAQFEDGRGRLVSAGGRVVKNVAGYDLTKFMVGQRGAFGRLVTITARAYRRPEAALAVRLPGEVDLAALSPAPQWAVLSRSGVWAGWVGDAAMIDLAAERLSQGAQVQLVRHDPASDAAMRRRLWTAPAGERADGTVLKISVPPGELRSLVVRERLTDWVADPWFGVLLTRVAPDRVRHIRDAVHATGGHAESLDASLPVRVNEVEAEVLRRIKSAIDPESRLARLDLEPI